jgi:serine/threonine protein kinase
MVGKPGQVLGQFTLKEKIGGESIGELWRARDNSLADREVLVKLLPPLDYADSLLKRESLVLSKIASEYVLRLFSVGSAEGIDYLVFEPIDGMSLRQKLQEKGGKLDFDEALLILCDVLRALDHIHNRQIYHTDLKPENIYVLSSGRAKVSDFSAAKGPSLPDSVSIVPSDTTGTVLGTPYYMSPEQWRGESDPDARSDLYSFGVLLYEALTGETPFHGRTLASLAIAHIDEAPPSLIALRPDLPPQIEDIFLKLVAKKKEDRFQTASEVESALVQIAPAHAARNPDWGQLNTLEVFGEEPAPLTLSPPSTLIVSKRSESPPSITLHTGDEPSAYQIVDQGRTLPGETTIVDADSKPRSSVFPVGTLLAGRYKVVEHIGQGGFANVYLAVDAVGYIQEEVAVKVPVADLDPDQLVRRLQSQFKAWKVLSETEPDQVVRLKNVERIEVEGVAAVAIFMEYMAGRSLWRMVKNKWNGLPRSREQLAQLMRLFLQVCRAVRSLHAQGLLHRDIKPDNLLLDVMEMRCKLSDFELVSQAGSQGSKKQGTIPYMAPECFDGNYSVASDVFALGVTLYYLLSGAFPFESVPPSERRYPPLSLTESNPIVVPELNQVVLRCLEVNPYHRPQSVDDLIEDLVRLGLTDEGANTAPVNLARLLLAHLTEEDIAYLIQSLEKRGFRSARADTGHQQADIIEEYCYTASPYEVLAQNCTGRQLAALARAMGRDPAEATDREELIADILAAIGFRPGPRQIPGIETTRGYLDGQLIDLANATTSDECIGMVHSGLAAVERTVDLLVRFYGQLLYGSGLSSFLSRLANGKPADRLTFGEKIKALRSLCSEEPDLPLAHRVRQVFRWPIISREVFSRLDDLVRDRNRLAHQSDLAGVHDAQRFGRQVLSAAVDVLTRLAENLYMPRVVQIISRQDDVYGRHFYLGRDDRGRSERIFTPLPLDVGQLYLFYPLTNPVRINPLIFPYDNVKRQM